MNSKRERLLQKINPKLLEMTPKLSGENGKIINLDCGNDTLKEGAKKLMLRFFSKQQVYFKSISTDDGIELTDANHRESYKFCQSISSRLSLPFSNENGFKLDRPGKKFQDLKKKLEEKMSEKRQEEYKKRVEEYKKWKSEQSEVAQEKEDFEDCNDFSEEDSENESDECKNENEDEPNEEDKIDPENHSEKNDKRVTDEEINMNIHNNMKENLTLKSIPADDYDNVDVNENDENDSCSDKSLILPYQPGGLLDTNSQSTQESQDLPSNLMSPSLNFLVNDSPHSKADNLSQDNKVGENNFLTDRFPLFSNSQTQKDPNDFTEAFDLCSGIFPEQSSQLKHQNSSYDDQETEKEEVEMKDKLKQKKRIISLEDSDEESNPGNSPSSDLLKNIQDINDSGDENENKNGNETENENEKEKVNEEEDEDDDEDENEDDFVKALKSQNRGARQALHFSDEEDSTDDCVLNNESDSNEVSENESEDEQDNDEDEENDDKRSVHYDSEENEIINPREFFDKEAELSGSEGWSDDEDERGLDEFEKEAGDEDNIDEEKMRTELGKIHARQTLNDDIRNIRYLQELYFEDGDLHSDEEYKKFRWKNLVLAKLKEEKIETFSTEWIENRNGESSDEEDSEDIQVRKERLERQLIFEKMKENGELFHDCELFENILRKLNLTRAKKQISAAINNDKENGSAASTPNPLAPRNARGSFLSRNEELLSRLAKVTSSVTDNVRGSNNGKNFVFATKSPEKSGFEKPENKRTAEDVENRRPKKKLKVANSSNPIPSILDLLG